MTFRKIISETENSQEIEGIDPAADEVSGSDIVSPFDPKKIKINIEQKTRTSWENQSISTLI